MLKTKEQQTEKSFLDKFNIWFDKVKDKYLIIAGKLVHNPKLTAKILGGLLAFTLFMLVFIPTGFLPTEDKGVVLSTVQLPDGAPLARTRSVCDKLEKRISKTKGVKSVITMLGYQGDNTAIIIAELDDWSKRSGKSSLNGLLKQFKQEYSKYPDANIVSFSPSSIPGLGMLGGFEYQLLDISGHSIEDLYYMALNLIGSAMQNPKGPSQAI